MKWSAGKPLDSFARVGMMDSHVHFCTLLPLHNNSHPHHYHCISFLSLPNNCTPTMHNATTNTTTHHERTFGTNWCPFACCWLDWIYELDKQTPDLTTTLTQLHQRAIQSIMLGFHMVCNIGITKSSLYWQSLIDWLVTNPLVTLACNAPTAPIYEHLIDRWLDHSNQPTNSFAPCLANNNNCYLPIWLNTKLELLPFYFCSYTQLLPLYRSHVGAKVSRFRSVRCSCYTWEKTKLRMIYWS